MTQDADAADENMTGPQMTQITPIEIQMQPQMAQITQIEIRMQPQMTPLLVRAQLRL